MTLSPRCKNGLCGFLAGVGMSLVLIAVPLLAVGGGGHDGGSGLVEATPLSALSTMPAKSPQFDISGVLPGRWIGEMCPQDGEPIPIRFEFTRDDGGGVMYSLAVTGIAAAGLVGEGACTVDGEDVTFHAFLAMLSSCDEACGVDRVYTGRFEEGSLVGHYHDAADEEACASCVGGGSWWATPAAVD